MIFVLAACGGDEGSEEASESPSPVAVSDLPAGPKGASAAFRAPKAGKVTSPVAVKMNATRVKITEAGKVRKGTGHYHVMIDTKCVARGKVIPEKAKHLHFGDGSTKTKLKLKPGKHTLCLQLGNGAHQAFGLTDTVKITVTK